MKTRNYFLISLLAVISFLFVGCSNDDGFNGIDDEEEAVMTIRLAGSSQTRAWEDVEDSKIKDYQVYVFSLPAGILEAKASGTAANLTTQITGLKTGSRKTVVVLTNLGTYPDITNYADIADNKIDLEDYYTNIEDNGYIMSGEKTNIQLVKGDNEPVEISLKRTVAKLTLESITFVPEDGHDLDLVTIKGVSAQRVSPEATLAPLAGIYGSWHYGGIADASATGLTQLDLLYNALDFKGTGYVENQKYTLQNTFLVYPNANRDNCTLLTIEADYNGETIYYPIKVNFEIGDENTDRELVESNKHYKLNITLKRFGDGTTGPENPNEEADIDVVISVEDWDVITQNTEW
ncbi:MAG: FimB/Mfa2 family fimbrial subunit [Odoribacter sp.]|nr:FimB/Mfa2 family fimbrial subunit [Odoribacter sp.]